MHANWRFLLLLAVLAAPATVYGQSFTASVSGAQVVPPTTSTATGSATVSVSGNSLTVNFTFSGLLGGAATAAHIHCCAPVGGNTGVAIPFPTFPATTSGTFTQTFDLTLSGIYDVSFFAANGGTAALAEAALLAGLAAGEAYVDIHDAVFPGGEIRGQLLALATTSTHDGAFQVGYAANLNIGDSVVNISNDGASGGISISPTNICVNAYVFDPQEEEIGCCYCLVTPNGLESLSAKSDLISNNLTPAVPTSIVIKLVATIPADFGAPGGNPGTKCNPATLPTGGSVPGAGGIAAGNLAAGMLVWGTTLEPASTPGTYAPVAVGYKQASISPGASLAGTEIDGLRQLCNFIQSNGTGYGICKSCRLGALGGAKQ